MNVLPKLSTKKLFITILTLELSLLLFTTPALAASAYISPATGLIKDTNFKISVYIESTATEPEVAGADIKISYPSNVDVVSINDGEFDSYLEKTYDPATRIITINALNNTGNYKTGKIKLVSINFEALATTGEVQLVVNSNSGISGAGGEQLLTETINGVYTIEIEESASDDATAVGGGGDTGDTTTTNGSETTTTEIPETGIVENTTLFLLLSLGLITLGVVTFSNPLTKRK